jgi:hypothetical protein
MIPPNLIRGGLGAAGSAFWVSGMDSSLDPAFLEDTVYRSAMNVTNRGGVLKTRPGYNCVFELPPGRLQGYTLFRPTGGAWHHVVAVAGKVYASAYPFTTYTQLPNVQFFTGSDVVVFEKATKSVQQNVDGTLSIVDPYDVLIMQDGRTAAAYWDGSISRHLNPLASETPLGTWMKWSGDRLWVGRDNELFASDIADPLRFTETEYLSEGGSFRLPDIITGLAEITSTDVPQLLVFTQNTTSIFQSNIRDRETWKTTNNFQRVLFPQVGCVSGRAITTQYGQLWWMTMTGVTSLNAAAQSRISSELLYRDTEMAVSKGNLSPNIERVAAISFENYVLFSVPSGDLFNRHTWVMDQSPAEKLNTGSPAAWNGVWTGTRPVQWSVGAVNGVQRVFHVSVDYDGVNRLWEAFIPTRQDNGQPITCYVETKSHANFGEMAQGLDIKTFRFAELEFTEIQGTLDVKVYWAGMRGNYKELTVYRFVAPEGNITYDKQITLDTQLFAYRPQARLVRTTEILNDRQEGSICGIESPFPDRHDRAFSLLIVWSGKAALRSYRIFARMFDESGVGAQAGQVEEVDTAKPVRTGLLDNPTPCDTAP